MDVREVIELVQNLGAPVVYSLLALWFIKFQFVKAEDAAQRGREERQRIASEKKRIKDESNKRQKSQSYEKK